MYRLMNVMKHPAPTCASLITQDRGALKSQMKAVSDRADGPLIQGAARRLKRNPSKTE
jgi:hypothetical protein